MHPALRSRLALAALFAAPFAHAQDAPPARPAQSELGRAFSNASQEIQDVLNAQGPLARNLDRLGSFQHTPATAGMLKAVIGNERPWSFERRADGPGYRWTLQPLRYTTPEGGLLEWSDMAVDLTLDKTGRQLAYAGAWPLVSFEDRHMRMTMRDASLKASQRRGPGTLWYGDVQGGADSVEVEARGDGAVTLQMRDLWLRSSVQERGANLAIIQSFGIGHIEVAGEQIDGFTLAYRLDRLSKASAVALGEAERRSRLARQAGNTDTDLLLPMLRELVRAAAKNKTALKVDELSVSYHGQKALLRGSVGVNGAAEADLKDMRALARRIDARFEVRVPLALVREIAAAVVRKQAQARAASGGKAADAALPSADNMTDLMVGKLLGNGYAKLENDTLVSTIVFRQGQLRVNGKTIDLPTPGQKAPQQQQQQQQQQRQPFALQSFMQARRVSDSCTLPAYPAAVVDGDAPLRLALRYTVDAQGGLRDLRVAQASAYPDYDAALLAAFASCRFMPALRNGKPVEHNDTFTLVREPGSTQP